MEGVGQEGVGQECRRTKDTFPCYLRSMPVQFEIVYSIYNTFCINAKTNNDCPTAVRAMKFVTFGSVNVAFAINMLHFLIKFCQVWPEI